MKHGTWLHEIFFRFLEHSYWAVGLFKRTFLAEIVGVVEKNHKKYI